jgi:DNA adenine methylase
MHQHPEHSLPSRPFLKWPGGKQRLMSQLLPLLPAAARFIEPFVGAGSVFLATNFERYVLNDANADLTAVWSALKTRPADFVERSAQLFVESNRNKEAFCRIREEFNNETDPFERAATLLYLNRFGFNGLYRVNRAGKFNVTYGDPASVPGFPREQLEAAAIKLATAEVLSGEFLKAIELARAGDVVYCDPPYSDSDTGRSFTAYTARGFTHDDHRALVDAGVSAAGRGAHVLISNHDTSETRALYRGWDVTTLSAWRSFSAKSEGRRTANELLAVLRPVS